MPLALYLATALVLLALVHKFVCTLSRRAAAFLLLLPFLFVGSALVRGRVYAPIDKGYQEEPLRSIAAEQGIGPARNPVTMDIYSQMIPWRHAVRESYARGEWPLWNPSILCGDILAGAAQPAAFSPFTLLAILLPAPISFTFTAAITFFLAAAGAFAFARDLGCRESTAAVAAAGFAFSSAIALYVLWPLGMSWALLPLVFLGTRRVATAPSVRAWALLTTAFTLLLLAGHGESALHVVALAALYGVFEVRSVRAIITAFAAGIAALLLSAIQLLPHLDVLRESAEYLMRMSWRGEVVYDPPKQVLASLVTNFFPFLHVRRWLDPALPAVKGETAIVGSIILALAIYALIRARVRVKWFFLGMALVGLAAQASWKGINAIFAKIPLFDVALNDRLCFAAAFAMAILAALGAEELARREDRKVAMIVFAVALLILGAGSLYITRAFVIDPGPVDWGHFKIAAELMALAAAIALLRAPMRIAIPLLVVLLLIQRTMTDGDVHKSFPQRAAYPHMRLFDAMTKSGRVVGQGGAFIANASALYAVEDVRGYEAMTFAPLMETYRLWCVPQPVFFNRVDDLTKPFLSLMNVRYAFAEASTPVPNGWRLVAKQGNATLLENTNVLDRAFLPRVVKLSAHRSLDVHDMETATDFRDRAWITAGVPTYERANGPGTVTIHRADATGYALDADMQGDGWIVVTSTNWNGWRAYLDNRRVKIQPANAAFLGVYVPRGKHAVRLVYWPDAFVRGRAITFFAIVAIVVFAVIRSRRVS